MKNTELIAKFKLPGYIAGMSFADASKKIDGKFKDRNDLISKRTKEELLNRLSQAQEYVKAQEQPQQEQLNPEQRQFADGVREPLSVFSSLLKPAEMTGQLPTTQLPTAVGTDNTLGMGNSIVAGDAAGITPNPMGILQGGLALNELAKGNGASRSNLGSAASGAMTGAMAGSSLGPIGTGVGALVGAGVGLLGANKRRDADAEIGSKNAFNANNVFRDKRYAALGGPLGEGTLDDNTLTADLVKQYRNKNMFPKPALINDSELMQPIYDSFGNLTTIGTLDTTVLTKFPKPRLVTNDSESMQPVYDKSGALTTVGTMNASVPETSSKSNLFNNLSKIGNYTKQNMTGESLRYAPVVMNALQLSKLKGPEHESLQRLTNTYQPQYMDEASIQNSINSENRNTINALTNASGGSESALRAGILGAGLNATKARSDAYMKMKEYNNNQNIAKQQFQLGIDQTNLSQSNMENDINARNKGNYETQKSKLLAQIGTDLGGIGKEELFKKYPKMMGLGYDWNGKYFVNTKTGDIKTEKEAAAAESTTKKAKGGFLSNKSLTYLNSLNKK